MVDSIIDEVRRIREEHAKKFNYDPEAIFADLKKQEERSKRTFVSFPAKRIRPLAKASKR
ncbi:MAG: hypothetical protein M3511_09640 [Deinococcota bacterium]|jgi:hypothetical protein|nr:hypothetical protein [Deinococcota bacterium]